MATGDMEKRLSPLIILVLVAALVAVIALWATDTSRNSGPVYAGGGVSNAEVIEWKLVTTWPKNFPGLGSAAVNLSRNVEAMSGGRLKIHVYGAGEIVPALGVFDAVSQGVADAGHGAAYYWKGKVPSSVFFTAVPFGLNAQETYGWLHYGGGLELWREAYAPFNLVPFAGGSTGVQMAGWFNKELNTADDLRGLKMRIPGLAGEVFAAAGGTAVTIPGGELYTSLQTGVIDALEWVGPYNDRILGFHEVARYYYYPGWHEPGSVLEFIVNEDSLNALPEDLRAIVEHAARAASQDMLDEYTGRNNQALQSLVDEHDVQLRRLPDDVLRALWQGTRQAMDELVARDPMAAKVYASYSEFYKGVRNYHHISEQAYYNLRDEVMGDEDY
ncbi:ABC transporter substrate-binding protein [Halioglobus sp. HI00S01]|uniref:TRAP transporter substrate-binding protein n=1 Tax=Halioglobus sp. HI00S01 TaxID=1822214 RepID=UPI0007C3F356|nr:TRAP transporter substrate-binding protein [Halioglobus sp. HI00S01]KZX55958.1 ABC transporter substrate-binding protein [Halioglobus sp. HI00S01]